jgi:hypothetical protein
MSTRRWWNQTPNSEPGFMHAPGNVARMPTPNLDDFEKRIRQLEGELIGIGTEIDRLGMKFNSVRDQLVQVREQMANRLKESGIKAEFMTTFPEIDMRLSDDEPVAR